MYTLRFPFRVSKPHEIAVSESRHDLGGGLSVRLDATDVAQTYAMIVDGFSDRAAAEAYAGVLARGATWLMLQRNVAIEAKAAVQKVVYFPEPRPFQTFRLGPLRGDGGDGEDDLRSGVYGEGDPVVFPTEERLVRVSAHRLTAKVTNHASVLLNDVATWLRDATTFVADERLDVASDLYRAHLDEQTRQARLLLLVMALECLCVPRPRSPGARAAVAAAEAALDAALDVAGLDRVDAAELQDVRQLLHFKADDSIRSQLRRLVREELAATETLEADVKLVGRLYDLRSKLVHDGHLDWPTLGDLPERARGLVQRVLSARITRMTCAAP